MAQKKFIIDGGFQTNADSVITGNLEMTGHVIPSVDSDGTTGYDLGTPTAKWRDLYLSSGSLYIDGQKVMESNSGTIVVQADPDQSLTTKVTGTGVLTLQSATTVSMAATLQMGTGKKITDQAGNAVVFGDKVDMDNNQIVNVSNPTTDQGVATKNYVDAAISGIINGAPGALDTLNELANALGDDANFASTVTNELALKAAITYVDTQDAATLTSANAYTDTRETAITTAYQTYADAAEADAISTAAADATAKANAAEAAANTYTDGRETAITTAYQTYADAAEADAISTANAYTDTRETAITTAYQSYADAAEADAISTANAYTDTRETAITTAYETYADQAETDAKAYTDTRETAITTAYQAYADAAEADAISTAAADATTKADAAEAAAKTYTDTRETAITTAYQAYADAAETAANNYTDSEITALDTSLKAYADTAEADARSYTDTRETAITTAYGNADTTVAANAAADATAKANAAETAAKAYTDTEISNLVGGAPGALDTLNELAAALGDDANYASTVTTELNSIKSAAVSSFTTFHERGANFTDTEETTNLTSTVSRTFASLANAVHFDVYLNRVLLRGPEAGVSEREYTVSGTTITFEVGIVASSDNIEVRGFSVGTIS